MSKKLAMIIALGLAPASVATSVSAQPAEKISREVRYGDLDLTSDVDVGRLQHRIRSVARAICGNAESRDLSVMQATAACRRNALAEAAPKIEQAVADVRSGRTLAANAVLLVNSSANN